MLTLDPVPVFGWLYYSLQRLRRGVTAAMVDRAGDLLEAPWAQVEDHVSRRLRALHGSNADAREWLARQPLIERGALISAMSEALGPVRGAERRKTSGSTGTPFVFSKDREMTAWMDAAMWAVYRWQGIAPGMRQARFWGMPQDAWPRLGRRITDWLQHRRRLDAFHLSVERSVKFFRALRRFRAHYAYGYPTLIRAFVDHCRAQNLDGRELGISSVVCTGELLAPSTREAIAEFFGARVVNEYGCTESGVLSFECESGVSHIVPVAAYPEVVTDEGMPLGEGKGQVVVSDLYGARLPLLRYRLHDLAEHSQGPCRCGRTLWRLHVEEGRIDSFIQTPHRGPVYDAILAYTVPKGILRFRARQVALDRLDVDVLPGREFANDVTLSECRRRWEEALGPDMSVFVRAVSDLPFDASGKLRYFIPMDEQAVEQARRRQPTIA